MAGRKQPYIRLETKEEFEKWYDEIKGVGYELGFEAGLTTALSYIMAPAIEMFSDWHGESKDEDEELNGRLCFVPHHSKDLASDAMYEYRRRELKRWKQNEAWKEQEIKRRVEEELLKKSSENPKT